MPVLINDKWWNILNMKGWVLIPLGFMVVSHALHLMEQAYVWFGNKMKDRDKINLESILVNFLESNLHYAWTKEVCRESILIMGVIHAVCWTQGFQVGADELIWV